METTEQLGGNTKSPRCVPAKCWCFTLNNYTSLEMETLEQAFKLREIKYGFGEEVGEQGTPHLQGWIESPKKIRPIETFRELKRIHWEKRRGTKEQNIAYCAKEGKYRTSELTTEKVRELLGIVSDDKLYDWQREVIELCDKPSDRLVYWVWSAKGCTGKTTLAKLLCLCHNGILLDGKKSDILYSATESVLGTAQKSSNSSEETHCSPHYLPTDEPFYTCKRIFILDLSRTCENFVSYDSIEKLKNGFWFSGKYESKMVMIPPPVVIIFANFQPDREKLSSDRWHLIEANKICTP